MLRDHVWTFAKRYVVITPRAGATPPEPWANEFQIPNNIGRMLAVECYGSKVPYELFQGSIYADCVRIELRYIEQFTAANDAAVYPADFAEACAAYLAAELAIPLTQNRSLFDLHFAQYKELLSAARFNGAVEIAEVSGPHTTWLDARELPTFDDIGSRDLASS